MKIVRNDKIMDALDVIALERSESDQDNYYMLKLINEDHPKIAFQNCETFDYPPFDRCRTDEDKRRMMASVLSMGAARRITAFNARNLAANIGLVQDLYAGMKELDTSLFDTDPYLNCISLPLGNEGEFSFGFRTYEADVLFHYGEPVEKGCRDILRLAYFREDTRYPVVTRNGAYFASVSADEILSAPDLIQPLSGDVLLYGLGIGYLTYLIHRKPSVSSVTVVEEDEAVRNLFLEHILPQFDHPEKIRVVSADPLQEEGASFTCVAAAQYAGSMQGVPVYLDMKKKENTFRKTKFVYKLEDSILSNIKSAMLIMCMAETQENGEELYETLTEDEQGREILNAVRPLFCSYTVQNVKALQDLFSNKSLRKVLKNESKNG